MLQDFLIEKLVSWKPAPPIVEDRTKRDVTLSFDIEPFSFLSNHLIFRVEKKEKIPPWVVVYSGGKTKKTIDNLAPGHPHRFRLKVLIKASALPSLAAAAIKHYGDEKTVYQFLNGINDADKKQENSTEVEANSVNTIGFDKKPLSPIFEGKLEKSCQCLESLWSDERWTSTVSDGTSALCFCMAVSCGYLKQVQQMLEERPELISVMNPNTGFTPLATGVRKGDVSVVRYLLSVNAEVEQRCSNGQTPLMLAVLNGHIAVAELLLERGADLKARDLNQLQVEHYAVDSGRPEVMTFVLDKGGDVHAKDNNWWTPLFRAICQGASTDLIEVLVRRGSNLEVSDRRQLTLAATARLLKDRHGRRRDSVLRLVDSQYQHEKIVANFTRLTKKISSVHTLLSIK